MAFTGSHNRLNEFSGDPYLFDRDMKKYSQTQRIIALMIIFILLIHLTGCVTSKIVLSNDLLISNKAHYIIHTKDIWFPLQNTVLSNGELSGKVDYSHTNRINTYNVYLTSDSVIKINTGNILSLPLNSISKIEFVKFAPWKTTFLVIGIAVPAIFGIGILSLSGGGDF